MHEISKYFMSTENQEQCLSHRARNPGKQLNKKSAYSTFFESAENSAPLLPRTCMLCKIFSDDQEMATNQKIGLCDYLRTEWDGTRSTPDGTYYPAGSESAVKGADSRKCTEPGDTRSVHAVSYTHLTLPTNDLV